MTKRITGNFEMKYNDYSNVIYLHSDDLIKFHISEITILDAKAFFSHYLILINHGYIQGTFEVKDPKHIDNKGLVNEGTLVGNDLAISCMETTQDLADKENDVIDITDDSLQGWFGFDRPLVNLREGYKYKIPTNDRGNVTARFRGFVDDEINNRPNFYYKFIINKKPHLYYYNGNERRFKIH